MDRRWLIILLLLVVLTGCAHNRKLERNANAQLKQYELAFSEYNECIHDAAKAYALSDAAPENIAAAAQSKCVPQFIYCSRALEVYLLAVVETQSGAEVARRKAEKESVATRQRMSDRVIQYVVELRLKEKIRQANEVAETEEKGGKSPAAFIGETPVDKASRYLDGFQEIFNAYTECMINAAEEYVLSDATPHEIAVAAQLKCATQFQRCEQSALEFMVSTAAPLRKEEAREKALAATSKIRQGMQENVMQFVSEVRSKTKSPSDNSALFKDGKNF